MIINRNTCIDLNRAWRFGKMSVSTNLLRTYKRFKAATRAGNEAFLRGSLPLAREHFEDALAVARRLFQHAIDRDADPEIAVSSLCTAYRNAAETLSRLQRFEEAGQHLEAACRLLNLWRSAPNAPEGLRHACNGFFPEALELCITHLDRHGEDASRILAIYEHTAETASTA